MNKIFENWILNIFKGDDLINKTFDKHTHIKYNMCSQISKM